MKYKGGIQVSSIKNIQAKIDQMEKLKKEIEETKKNINNVVGETLIKELSLDYENLSSKKEINLVIKNIKECLPNDNFKIQQINSNEIKDDSHQKNNNQHSEQPSNHNRNF
uniref:hypothetical protein n=1 Tax=Carnobacterium TaxID=2747 RepID=UPI00344E546B